MNQEEIFSLCRQTGCKPFYATLGKASSTGKRSKASIIVISDRQLQIYSQKSQIQEGCYDWVQLKRMSFSNKSIAMLFRPKIQMELETNDLEKLKELIIDIAKFFMDDEYLAKINLTRYNVRNRHVSQVKILDRLKIKNVPNFAIISNIITSFLVYQQKEVDLNIFPCVKDILPVLDVIMAYSYDIISLHVPQTKGMYSFLTNVINIKCSLLHLDIEGKDEDYFSQFINSFKNNPNQAIKSLAFTDSDFSKQDFAFLSDCIKAKNITNVTFSNIFDSNQKVYDIHLTSSFGNQLQYLSLDRIKSLKIQEILSSIPNIFALSLTNCDLDISPTLNYIRTANISTLKLLNLSSNVCTGRVFQFPTTLRLLVVNGVKWDAGCISLFAQSLFGSFPYGIELSMSNTNISATEWLHLTQYLETAQNPPLRKLVWNYNFVPDKFFKFLANCSYLETLSLCDCFDEMNAKTIAGLNNYLKNALSLKQLYLRGNKTNYLGKYLNSVLVSLEAAPSLEFLDITCSHATETVLYELSRFITNSISLNSIAFDGIYPSDGGQFVSFLSEQSKQTRVKISFPSNDLNLLLKNKQITAEQMEETAEKFRIRVSQPQSVYDDPFCIYRYYYSPLFPLYLTPEIIEQYSQPLQLIPNESQQIGEEVKEENDDSNEPVLEVKTPPKRAKTQLIPKQKLQSSKTAYSIQKFQKTESESDKSYSYSPRPQPTSSSEGIETRGSKIIQEVESSSDFIPVIPSPQATKPKPKKKSKPKPKPKPEIKESSESEEFIPVIPAKVEKPQPKRKPAQTPQNTDIKEKKPAARVNQTQIIIPKIVDSEEETKAKNKSHAHRSIYQPEALLTKSPKLNKKPKKPKKRVESSSSSEDIEAKPVRFNRKGSEESSILSVNEIYNRDENIEEEDQPLPPRQRKEDDPDISNEIEVPYQRDTAAIEEKWEELEQKYTIDKILTNIKHKKATNASMLQSIRV